MIQITLSFFHCSNIQNFHFDFEHVNYINTSKLCFLRLYNKNDDNLLYHRFD